MSTQIAVPEFRFEGEALSWPEKAKLVRVIDQPTYDQATQMLIAIKGLRQKIAETFDEPIAKAFAAHRAMTAAKKKVESPLEDAERIIKGAVGAFHLEQQRIRQELERKAREDAERQAEQTRLEMAVQAEEMGASPEVVAEVLETPIPVAPVAVAPTFNRAAGVSTRETWKCEVVDLKALCRAVADGKASIELVQPNMVTLNSLARGLKSTFAIPGCRVVVENIVSARAR